jgi:ABC-type transport system substrate-binding protein
MKPHLYPASSNPHLHRSYLLSRRAFLRTSLLLGGATALTSLAGGCAPQTATDQAGAAPAAADSAAGPKPGGSYRLVGQGDFRTLDPPGAESSEDWWSAGMVLFNQLYFYDKDGNFYADLAADLPQISDDGMVYSIPIRQGVKFHNGRGLVADDVKFTLERQLWPEVYSWGKSYMENIVGYDEVIAGTSKELSGIKVVDDYTVEVTLKKPQAVFPALLSMSMNGIIPHAESQEAGDEWGYTVVIGTGPFKFVEWVAGEKAIYERNPDYHRGAPYIERIELSLNVDPAVQMLRWENGEVEWVTQIPAAELPRVLSDDTLKAQVRQAPGLTTDRLAMHFGVKPFDDLRVRQAVAMAIDKQAIVQKRAGTVLPLEGYFTVPMLQYEADFKSNYLYDPERAKALLAEAGVTDLKGVMMYIGQDTEIGQLLQADLQAIGIETELAVGQWKEWRDRIRNGDVPLFLYGWAASFPDAYDYTAAWTTCAAIETGYNDGHYCNERIDEILEQVEALPLQDPERIAGYREIEDIVINQDVAWVGLFNPQQVRLGKSYVHDDFVSPIYGWPYLETAWMETSA